MGKRKVDAFDRYRFMAGFSTEINPIQYDYEEEHNRSEYLLSVPVGIKVRFFNASRKARNRFALEFGPVGSFISSKPATSDVGMETGFIYKANKFFGVGIIVGPRWCFTEVEGEGVAISMLKVGGELHFFYDMLRLGTGAFVAPNNGDVASPYFQALFDLAYISTAAGW